MSDNAWVGLRVNPDGTAEAGSDGRRCLMLVSHTEDVLRIDPEVVIEGDGNTLTISAPFTPVRAIVSSASRIICESIAGQTPFGGGRWVVDQRRILEDAQRTGRREFRLSDYLLPETA